MTSLDKQIHQFFWDSDTDRSGTISMDELRRALLKNGYKLTPDTIKECFESFDENADGQISFDEYLNGMGRLPSEVHRHAEIWRVYKEFDTDGDGFISKVEIGQMFKHMGKELSSQELNNIMKHLDNDNSGRIEFNEFLTIFEES